MADSIEEVVYDYLTTDSSFMGDFSGVYWQEADASVSPYIVFWLVDDNGTETRLNKAEQGECRIQFDLWDTNKIRGARLHTALTTKVKQLNEILGGYYAMTTGTTKQTFRRESTTEPFHFVVDGVIKWNKV